MRTNVAKKEYARLKATVVTLNDSGVLTASTETGASWNWGESAVDNAFDSSFNGQQ